LKKKSEKTSAASEPLLALDLATALTLRLPAPPVSDLLDNLRLCASRLRSSPPTNTKVVPATMSSGSRHCTWRASPSRQADRRLSVVER